MFSKTIVVLSLAIFSVALAGVTPQDQAGFEDFLNANQNTLMDLQASLMKALGVENPEQLQNKALDMSKEYAAKLDDWARDIKKQTRRLKNNPEIRELRTSVKKAAEDFKLQNSESTTDLENFVEKANKAAEEILGKIKNLSESQSANIKEFAERLWSDASTKFETISNEFKSQSNIRP